jgi:hypothetical protein
VLDGKQIRERAAQLRREVRETVHHSRNLCARVEAMRKRVAAELAGPQNILDWEIITRPAAERVMSRPLRTGCGGYSPRG